MTTIEKQPFGSTGHMSTRTILGSVCLRNLPQSEADAVLDLLFEYDINHIDTAPAYGDAELRLGPWMKRHRERFFLATKTDQRTYAGTKEQFHRSLDRLRTDRVDLLQLHNLTDVVGREIIFRSGGALEFLVEAKDGGLTRFIGITGHGLLTPQMHLQSLERFRFDTVLLPCNYPMMQNPIYSKAFQQLVDYCGKNGIAVQTIKSIARGLWGDKKRTHTTWYEPLSHGGAITKAVHWVLAIPGIFLITVGDVQELPKVLAAAAVFKSAPPDAEMNTVVEKLAMKPLFDQAL